MRGDGQTALSQGTSRRTRDAVWRGELVRRLGRLLLWTAVALVLTRGLFSFAADGKERSPVRAVSSVERQFPDAAAEAFAVSFARAYLTFAPGRQEWVAPALRPYLSSDLPEDAGLEVPDAGPNQVVEEATVADTLPLDERRGLVTIAATVSRAVVTTRYLSVPVARDAAGGLAVYDYPAFVPPPARARVERAAVKDLASVERTGIEAVLRRFFPVFFAGRSAELDYFLPADARLRALPERYAFLELVSVERAPGANGAPSTVLAAAEVRDRDSKARHVLRYRVSLERRERWYVRAINDA